MRAPSWFVELSDRLRLLDAFPLLTRVLVPAAAVVSCATASAIGGFSGLVTVVLLVTAVVAAAFPDSSAPLVLILVMTGTWFAEVRPFSLPWSIVLAVCVLVVHVASSRAATLVPGTAFDRESTILWLRQTGLVAVGTLMVWVVSVLLAESPGDANLVVAVVAVVAVAALGVGLTLATASEYGD
jgi:hypothetical protein